MGLVLAAGSGRRMGAPKALLRTTSGESWAARAARVLGEGGCSPVLVTTGAGGEQVARGLPAGVRALPVADAATGLGAGLRAGLDAAGALHPDLDAVVVTLVDLPDVDARAVASVLAAAGPHPRSALVRATWAGRPGHPVLLGRDALPAARRGARGDTGARGLLAGADVVLVEQHPAPGRGGDVDSPGLLPAGTRWPDGVDAPAPAVAEGVSR
ncbi:nucleotidyltransferase family protein [Kineococcus gypseus]|uniref:nucleotidyltransferase family protein n=1 Tax=Kineococcus gypseus TaxID=1637102 RepID=UPI003D7E7D40